MGDTTSENWTTASVEAVPQHESTLDPTPGLVLIYSRLHEQLPSALAFAASPTTIGRDADNNLTVPEAAVSRFHVRIEERADGWWIVDNGSTNGTLVNGQRVPEMRLEDHDVVRIGDTVFRYAQAGIYGYSAYRIDGTVIEQARPVHHGIRDPLLAGGYQVDCILERVAKVAPTPLAVVVHGESGTGKELVARELHRESARQGAFQAINCAALPANLIESELFGYRKGAFTGATQDKRGLIRAAHGGTLFLDEIGDMPVEAQAKLLRVLQEKEVLPIGATVAEPVDVRIVCATHRDLDAYVVQGKFRGDLLARLREVQLDLPPLRRRREDIYGLTRHFLKTANRGETRVSFSYVLGLAHYAWPYNVRELESAVKLSLALCEGQELDLAHLPDTVRGALEGHGAAGASPPARSVPPSKPPPGSSPSEEELRALLSQHEGNIAAVGRELGKERMQVHRWLKRYGIDIAEYRSS